MLLYIRPSYNSRFLFTRATRNAARIRAFRHRKVILRDGIVRPDAVVPVLTANAAGQPCAVPMAWGWSVPRLDGKQGRMRIYTVPCRLLLTESPAEHRCAVLCNGFTPDDTSSGKPDSRNLRRFSNRDTHFWACGIFRIQNHIPSFLICVDADSTGCSMKPVMLSTEDMLRWISKGCIPGLTAGSGSMVAGQSMHDGSECTVK